MKLELFPCYNNYYALTIDNVLSSSECKKWIKIANETGWEQAQINIGNGKQMLITDNRNNQRSIVDSQVLSSTLFSKIKKHIPNTLTDKNNTTWYCTGLNERLRFLHYKKGTFFKKHFDGSYVRGNELGKDKNGEKSFITVQLYLNTVPKNNGGATRFFDTDNENSTISVKPEEGKVLLFEHKMLHDGETIYNDNVEKYCVRTDVMYSKKYIIL